jgi:DNA-binding HxlR family transcriptional regulator
MSVKYGQLASTRFSQTEIQILALLEKTLLHVRALRRELDDNGAVSIHLKHLQELGLIKREKRKGRVVNALTPKGRRLAKALKLLAV